MSARVEEEATETGFYGDRVTDREGLLVIWDTAGGSSFVLVLGKNVVVLQQLLAGSGI